MVNELSTKLAALEKKLGPEYSALIVGLEDIDPETEIGQDIESVLLDLDKLVYEVSVENPKAPAATRVIDGSASHEVNQIPFSAFLSFLLFGREVVNSSRHCWYSYYR